MITVDKDELAAMIRAAVRAEFAAVGLYAETPQQAEDSRLDLSFLRYLRRGRDGLAGYIANALVISVLGFIAFALGLGFKAWTKG